MAANDTSPGRASFGDFEFDPRALELRKHGMRIKVQGQPLEILALLLERPGELVAREELQQKLWPGDTFVDFEQSLNAAIKRLRAALDDSAEQPKYVETLARRGYRFIGHLNETPAAPVALPPAISTVRRPIVALVAVITLLAVGYAAWRWRQPVPPAETKRVMLAVLPFENLSGDSEQDYFSDGLTEEVITQLGSLHPGRLGVIARNSVMLYKRKPADIRRIASELGVDYVLEGSVRREGDRVRISAQLIQARDQTHLWAQNYERDFRGILALQQDLAGAIGREIQLKLTPDQQARLATARPVNPEAHEAYLKGLYYWNKFTVEGLLKSQELFQQAIEKDPGFAAAYAGLAASYALQGNFSVLPPGETYPKSLAASRKAIELDETVSFAHSQLGFVTMYYDRDWAGAERAFKRAIELNPSNANAHEGYAFYFIVKGQFDQARAEIGRAREIDPLSLIINSDVGLVAVLTRRYDDAIRQLQRTLEMNPDFPPAHWVLAHAYEAKGMFREAYVEELKATALARNDARWVAGAQEAYDTSGWEGVWSRRLELMLAEQSKGRRVSPYRLALAYARAGDKAKAIDYLEKAVDERFYLVVFLKVDSRFDSLRGEPRFQALLRRMNLPE